ncbi:MAG: hypothetical protein GX620_16420 [Chloroflexi bacterium]|nr:hypothetical protein [Chloroflexota bacterium]
MATGWRAFRMSLSRTVRYYWAVVIAFVINLASTLVLTALPALGLALLLGHRPAIRQVASGAGPWVLIEMLLSPVVDTHLGVSTSNFTTAAQRLLLFGLTAALLSPLAAWIPASFLSGGILLTYAEAPSRFRLRRFLWGCWHWFGSFLALGVVQIITGLVILCASGGLLAITAAFAEAWPVWILLPSVSICVFYWLGVFDITRGLAVVKGTRNIFAAMWDAVRVIVSKPLVVSTLFALVFLILGAIHALFAWGVRPAIAPTHWPLLLVLQQAFVILRLAARMTRLSGAVTLSSIHSIG